MRFAVITEPGNVLLQEAEAPSPGAGEVLIELSACGICTLDRRLFSGEQPIYPVAVGHEAAGRVAELGSGVANLAGGPAVGDLVAVDLRTRCGGCAACQAGRSALCQTYGDDDWVEGQMLSVLGGMADVFLAKAAATYVLDDVPASQAAQCEPLACVAHSIRRSGFRAGDHVAVIGGGYMGRLHLSVLRQLGASSVGIIDVSEDRLGEATVAGASWTGTPDNGSSPARKSEVVFVTVGVPGSLELALSLVAVGGTVVLFGAFPKNLLVEVNPQDFHHHEYSLVGVYAQEPADWRSAAGLISGGAIAADLDALVSARFALEDVSDAFEMTASQPVYRVFVGED